MNTPQTLMRQIAKLGLILMMGGSMNVNAGLFGIGGDSWKEEVLLYDGSKMIVERSQSYGGRHEFGQESGIKEHSITFKLPNANKEIIWTSEYGEDAGDTNFDLLALHILNGIPYIVATPSLCLNYNKWGRPNPPYVIFKHDGKDWQRITIQELPTDLTEINLLIDTFGHNDVKRAIKSGYISAETVRKLNSGLKRPEFKTILREPLPNYGKSCGEMVYDGNGGWIGIGWFKNKSSQADCLRYCAQEKITSQYCPCATLFKEK